MLVPNRRNLINALLGTNGFQRREPQQFGMVSFTELRREDAVHHREAFGAYGIAVTWEWAQRQNAQRVIYMGNGPVMDMFAWLFQFGRAPPLPCDLHAAILCALNAACNSPQLR